MTIEPLVANRLIPLDKGEGAVRPIGVGDVLRRICGKCVMSVAKKEDVEASGSLQLCAGQTSGGEAAIHATHTIFESDDTDAVLLIAWAWEPVPWSKARISLACKSNKAPCWTNSISVTSVTRRFSHKLAQQEVRSERLKELEHRAERIKEMTPRKTQRALDLAEKEGSSAWLTMLPLQDLSFNLNTREFRDTVKQRYDWLMEDIPSTCACGKSFTVNHSMICKLGGLITQCQNELGDLEAEFLSMVCSDIEIEPVLQDISGEQLNRDEHGFWVRHRSAFFDVRVCHPNAVSHRDLEPQQIYRIHENEKKRLYSKRVLDIERGTFTPLVFTTTGGMRKVCLMYHSRLAQFIAIKKRGAVCQNHLMDQNQNLICTLEICVGLS